MNTAHTLLERYYKLIIHDPELDFQEWLESIEILEDEIIDFFKNKNPHNNEISTTGLGDGTTIKSPGNSIDRY